MARPGVLYEEVTRAADELTARGGPATIERVRQVLGGGSFSTISRHLRVWREERQQAQEAAVRAAPPPDAVGEAVQQVWREIHLAADRKIAEARAEAEQKVAEAQREAAAQVELSRLAQAEATAAREMTEAALRSVRDALAGEQAVCRRLEIELAGEQRARAELERRVADLRQQAEETGRRAAEQLAGERQSGAARVAELERGFAALLKSERGAAQDRLAQSREQMLALEANLRERIASLEAALTEARGRIEQGALQQQELSRAATEEQARLATHNEALARENRRLCADKERAQRERVAAEQRAREAQQEISALHRRLIEQQEQASSTRAERHAQGLSAVLEAQDRMLSLLRALPSGSGEPGRPPA